MSSHREAPGILNDPAADNTDVYAFVSPDDDSKVTLIANYLPVQEPAGGPNFYLFGDDVLYEIHVDNDGDGESDITYQFRFQTHINNPNTFLYNTGPITSLDAPTWNIRQTYSVTKVTGNKEEVLAENLISPPCNIGPSSTPDYASLAMAAVHSLDDHRMVFAGQRDDPFSVDLGSVFDLGTLRPFQELHAFNPFANMPGIDSLSGFNVHSIALQVPKTDLTRDGSDPTDVMAPESVIGVYASASRQKNTMLNKGELQSVGPYVQVSRLGNPLINEVVIPLGLKDEWNASDPAGDDQFVELYRLPLLSQLLPTLYPGVFPNLEERNELIAAERATPRNDIVALLLTGLPEGVVPGFQNFTGETLADLVRLNMAIPPSESPNPLGLVAGDPAGFPNGRRLTDNVVAIELRVLAGVTYPLIDPEPPFTPDAAASELTDGTASNDVPFLDAFPYVAHPHQGYTHQHKHTDPAYA